MSLRCIPYLIVAALVFIPAISVMAEETAREQGVITVTGSFRGEFPPDRAMVTLAVETRAKTVRDASKENSARADRVMVAVKRIIDLSAGDKVVTSRFHVQPEYEYHDRGQKRVLAGYLVQNQVTVTMRNIERVGELIESATEAGANTVSGIRFLLADDRKHCEGLLVKAARQAQDEARVVAGALGATLGNIRRIAPVCGGEGQPPVFRGAGMMAAEMADTPVPVEAGPLTLQGTVTVEFWLAP